MAYSKRIKRSALVDRIMDAMILAFADQGHTLAVAVYQKDRSSLASPNAVRAKLPELGAAEALRFSIPSHNARKRLLVPTEQTVDFYNLTAPMLRNRATALSMGSAVGV